MIYDVQIRNSSGDVIATTGNSYSDTLIKLARRSGLCGRSDSIAVDNHFKYGNAPWPLGTHHVQFGHKVSASADSPITLGNLYVVGVSYAN